MAGRKHIAKGAEADIYEGRLAGMPAVFKVRKPKAYRVRELDESIRTSRTRKEARLLHAAKQGGVQCPLVLAVSKYEIAMSRVEGRLMMKMDDAAKARVCPEVGLLLAALHEQGVSHGDFTPANILAGRKGTWVIDFGLGEFTHENEELATDLLLMKKSLPAKAYAKFLHAYKKARGRKAEATLSRLKEIEKRGRYVIRGSLA